MTPFQLDIFIRSQNIKRKDICRAINCTEGELSATILGLRKNYRIREALAKYFHKSVDELFGADHAALAELLREPVAQTA
jgi:hypothetical protein